VDVAHVALLPDQIYHVGRHFNVSVGFVGLRNLFNYPLILGVYDHITVNMENIPGKVFGPF
jgi:hypothetical protein